MSLSGLSGYFDHSLLFIKLYICSCKGSEIKVRVLRLHPFNPCLQSFDLVFCSLFEFEKNVDVTRMNFSCYTHFFLFRWISLSLCTFSFFMSHSMEKLIVKCLNFGIFSVDNFFETCGVNHHVCELDLEVWTLCSRYHCV